MKEYAPYTPHSHHRGSHTAEGAMEQRCTPEPPHHTRQKERWSVIVDNETEETSVRGMI
jgi:hypothetical protein